MAQCPTCGKFLSSTSAASCTSCPGIYHKECVGMHSSATVVKGWACPQCLKKIPKGDISDTLSENSDLMQLRRELAEYMAEQREFRIEIRTAMSRMDERMNGLEKRIEALEIKDIAPEFEEATVLREFVKQLELDLNDSIQDSLTSDLDIGHLPEEKGENVMQSVISFASKLGITVDDNDIVFAERIGAVDESDAGAGAASKRPRRVLVRLTRRTLRDDLLRAARTRQPFNTSASDSTKPSTRIYVNERLTRINWLLFHRVQKQCRAKQWKYCWTRRGRIYVRKGDGLQAYHVRSDDEMSNILGTSDV